MHARLILFRHWFVLAAITIFLVLPSLDAQKASVKHSGPFTEISWDGYIFKFMPGNQMAQVLDVRGNVIGSILAMNGGLQILPTITGTDADRLKSSFQSWKDQGGEKALTNGTASPTPLAKPSGAPLSKYSVAIAHPERASSNSSSLKTTTSKSESVPVGQNSKGDAGHGVLQPSELQELNNGVRFDLNAIRLNPSLLDNITVMQYFIGLNNCHDREVQRALQNELDFPALAKYYKSTAAAILAPMPDTVGLKMFVGNTKGGTFWGKSYGGYDPKLKTLALGEYDAERNVFPILVSDKSKSFEVSGTQHVDSNRALNCPVADDAIMRSPDHGKALPLGYNISIAAMSFHELPLSEAEARKYIDSVSSSRNRGIYLAVDVHLGGSATSVGGEIEFSGNVARIYALNAASNEIVGTLFDDHSLAAPVIKEPPTVFTTMKTPDDVALELNTVVYVSLASDYCGWPLDPGQKANLGRFMSDINNYGRFNDKYKLNMQIGQIRTIFNSHPGFCRIPSEREAFEKRAATLWPKGPMGAPAR